jgi:hypothetical protein
MPKPKACIGKIGQDSNISRDWDDGGGDNSLSRRHPGRILISSQAKLNAVSLRLNEEY